MRIKKAIGVGLLGAALMTPVAAGCELFRANSQQMAVVAVYDAVIDALQLLDIALGKYADSLPVPSLEELARLEDMSAKLQSAKQDIVASEDHAEKGEYEKAKTYLASALLDMSSVAGDLEALGVKLPKAVSDGLRIGLAFVGGSDAGVASGT
jgi:hypothetical protein